MEKYTEEKKQYYMNIMKAISEHKDFGKRNPVDIGMTAAIQKKMCWV